MRHEVLTDLEFSQYEQILSTVHHILTQTNNSPQANIVIHIRSVLERRNMEAVFIALNSVDMWGGAGAVWEVNIDDENLDEKFKQNIIWLIDLMESTHLLGTGIKRIKKLLKS